VADYRLVRGKGGTSSRLAKSVLGAALASCALLLLPDSVSRADPSVLSPPWVAGERVNDDSGTALQDRPDIAVDSAGNAYAVWRDLRNGTYNGQWDLDIYFSYRPAGGKWRWSTATFQYRPP